MANEEAAIDVDAVDAVDAPPSPRIKRGTGDANQPLELASSDSENEKPAKRVKLAPVTPSPPGNAQLAQLRREREARRGPPPPPQPEVIQDAEGVRGLVVVIVSLRRLCAFGQRPTFVLRVRRRNFERRRGVTGATHNARRGHVRRVGIHIDCRLLSSHFINLQNTARATPPGSQYSRYIKTSPRGRRRR